MYGDLPNDQNDPGGEAQLDVEYIMVISMELSLTFHSPFVVIVFLFRPWRPAQIPTSIP